MLSVVLKNSMTVPRAFGRSLVVVNYLLLQVEVAINFLTPGCSTSYDTEVLRANRAFWVEIETARGLKPSRHEVLDVEIKKCRGK